MSRVFDALNPGSKLPRTEQFALAWKVLGDGAESASDRWHAKCWLTHRTIQESQDRITYPDWQKHVEAVQLPLPDDLSIRARWAISQTTAEFYLGLLEDEKLAGRADRDLFELVEYGALRKWPAGSLNVLRISCLRAYRRYLAGEPITAQVQEAFLEWTQQFHFPPFQWCEIMDAGPVLKCMAYMAEQEGTIIPGGFPHDQASRAISPDSKQPWVRCMYRLGENHPRSLWTIPGPEEGRLVNQYRIIHAQKRYGPGGLKPEWTEVYHRLTRNLEVRSVLDYGCGRSQDIKSLWPEAQHAFYDPAIPGIHELPDQSFSLGYCTQVMEHIPREEVEATFRRMQKLSPWWVLSIHKLPANQILPNGENAHCTQENESWWAEQFRAVFGGTVHTEPMSPACFYLTNIPQHD